MRHQCLIYEGSPSRHLASLAQVVRERLAENFRCFYLNSPPMVAGMRSYLAAAGVDVAHEVSKASLVVSADRSHLDGDVFSVDRMLELLENALDQALEEGYRGLWATGDMTWEFGPQKDFGRLLEYEWRLEELFRRRDHLCGICQYHEETLPNQAPRQALLSHQAIFVNQTLSRINPHYIEARSFADLVNADHSGLHPDLISRLVGTTGTN